MPAPKRVGNTETPITVNVGTQTPAAPAETAEDKAPLEPNWFFDRLAEIRPEDWARVYTLQIIRQEPKLPGLPGSKGFLDAFTEPVTQAMVKARYGGGKFRLVLLKNNKYQTSHDFDIEGDPIYQRGREAAPENANGSALEGRLLNMMEANMRELKDELKRREATGGDPAFEKALNILTTAYTTGIGAVQKEQANPTALLKDLVSTAKEMGVLGGNGNGNGDTGIVGTIRVLKELGLIGNAATQQNPLEQLNLFLSIFEKMDELRGEGGGRRRHRGDGDWKETLANKFGDALPTILERMGQPRARPGVRPGVAPQQPQRPSVQPNTPAARPAAPRAPAPPATGLRVVSSEEPAASAPLGQTDSSAQEQPAQQAAVEVMAPEQLAAIEEQAYFVGVKRRVVEAVKQGDEGSLIVDFLELAWPQMVNYLESYSPEQITTFLANDPVLAEAVHHSNWPRVLQQAQDYLAEDVPAERVTH